MYGVNDSLHFKSVYITMQLNAIMHFWFHHNALKYNKDDPVDWAYTTESDDSLHIYFVHDTSWH